MNCLFCNIINQEIPAKIIGENDFAIAFLDVNPISDGHTIVIPKQHYRCLSECQGEVLNGVIELTKTVANVLMDSKLKPWGFNYLSNEGSIAGQEIFHFHIHVIPKYGKDEGLKMSIGNHYVTSVEDSYEIILKTLKKYK